MATVRLRYPPVETIDSAGTQSEQNRLRAKRNIFPLVGGQAVSLFGDYVSFFAISYFVLSLTGNPIDLGFTAAADTAPMLLFGLAAGVFLDRRRRLGLTLVAAELVRAAAFIFIAIGAFQGWATPPMVFLIAFVVGSAAVVFDSGLQTYMTRSLLDEDLVRVNAHISLARTLTLSVGPLAAGILIAFAGGFALAFGINAVTFLISAALLASIRPIKHITPSDHEPFLASIRSGVSVLFADKRLKWATLGGTFTNLVFQPLEILLVLFVATEVLGLAPGTMGDTLASHGATIGLFFAAQAAIGSVGVAFAGRVARSVPLGTMYVVGLAMLGSGFLAVALIGNWWAVIPAGIAITGVTWVNVALVTMRQQLAPPEQMGRVIAASRTFAWAGLPVGAAIGGILAGVVGVVPVYIFGASGVIVVAAFLTRTPLYRDSVMAGETS